jgi:ATP-binding cassette subfamily B protein
MANSASQNDTRRVVRRLFGLSWKYRKRALEVFCFQVVLLAMTLGGVGLTGVAIDIIRHALDPSAPEPRWPLGLSPRATYSAMESLLLLGGAVVVMALVRGAAHFAYSIGVGKLVHAEIVPSLRAELYRKLQRLSFRFFDAHASGAIINRVTRDVQMLRSFVDGVVIQGAVLLLALGVFLTYMFATHVKLTLVSMVLTPLLYVVTAWFSRWARPAYQENRRLADDMVKSVAEGVEGVVVTKVFGREQQACEGFRQKNQALRDQQRAIFRNVSRFVPGIDLLNHFGIVVLMGYGALLVREREITLGDLVVFAGLLQQFATRASSMATIVNTLQQSLIGARRVFEVLDAPLEASANALTGSPIEA